MLQVNYPLFHFDPEVRSAELNRIAKARHANRCYLQCNNNPDPNIFSTKQELEKGEIIESQNN